MFKSTKEYIDEAVRDIRSSIYEEGKVWGMVEHWKDECHKMEMEKRRIENELTCAKCRNELLKKQLAALDDKVGNTKFIRFKGATFAITGFTLEEVPGDLPELNVDAVMVEDDKEAIAHAEN